MNDIGHNNPPDAVSLGGSVFLPAKVRAALHDLEAQCQRAEDFADSFSAACESVAVASGIKPAVLKAYIKARVADKLSEQQQRAEQMTMLLDEIG